MFAPRNKAAVMAAYLAMLAAAGGAFWLVVRQGEGLVAPPPEGAPFAAGSAATHGADPLVHFLLALAVIIAVARALGALFARIGQPPVIGEVVAGILLGPSVLGHLAPGVAAFLLPAAITPHLGLVSQVGIVLFLFLVGVELDTSMLRDKSGPATAVAHASVVAPFALGSTFALYAYPRLSSSDVPFHVFALFLGVSLSVTAFPVLARILRDQRLDHTPLGVTALTCAAIDDVTAWCLLAFVVGIARADVGGAVRTVAGTAVFLVAMVALAGPVVRRWVARYGPARPPGQAALATALVALLASALATEVIGIHALFGAFILGALVPHGSEVAAYLHRKLDDMVVVLLLPAFFALSGLRTEIGLLGGASDWLLVAFVVLLATAGKLGGTALAARLSGFGWRDATALGALLNTRGLMQLIVLNVGLELRAISPKLFAVLVVMALVTTLMTAPLLRALTSTASRVAPGARASRPT